MGHLDWFNHRQLYEACGDIPPAELEAAYNRQHTALAEPVNQKTAPGSLNVSEIPVNDPYTTDSEQQRPALNCRTLNMPSAGKGSHHGVRRNVLI